MAVNEYIEAFRNLKTNKLFILIDEANDRFRLVNPEGGIVSLPADLFAEDPELFEGNEVESVFSAIQLATFRDFMAEQDRKADLDARARAEQKQRKAQEVSRVPAKTPSRPSGQKRTRKEDGRTGLGASWSGASLTFYRPQIDRLGLKQSFKVDVDGVGSFQLTKQQFLSLFSDVVLSPQYKAEGFFAYREIPAKAMQFLKT